MTLRPFWLYRRGALQIIGLYESEQDAWDALKLSPAEMEGAKRDGFHVARLVPETQGNGEMNELVQQFETGFENLGPDEKRAAVSRLATRFPEHITETWLVVARHWPAEAHLDGTGV